MAESRSGGVFTIGNAHDVLDALVRRSDACIAMLDLDGRVVRWNSACEEQFGWLGNAVLGLELPHVPVELRRRVKSEIRGVAASETVSERDMEALRADGTSFLSRQVIIPISNDEGVVAGVVTLMYDLAEDERLERGRLAFAEMIAARLRGPLSDAVSAADMLGRPEFAEPLRRARAANVLTGNLARALRFVDDLALALEFESGAVTLRTARVDVGELAASAVRRLGADASRVVVDVDHSLGGVEVDAERLEMAIVFMLEAAIAATTAPERVTLSLFERRGTLSIDVCDKGPGLDDDELALLFESALPGSDPRARRANGMGLSLARGIVEAHGGRVRASNVKGGVCIAATVPIETREGR